MFLPGSSLEQAIKYRRIVSSNQAHIIGCLKFAICYNQICFGDVNHFKDNLGQ